MSSRSQQAFLDGLHSPGFEQLISDIMREGGSGYRPDTQFGGSPVHLDLNEPMSGPSHLFMALGGTPPSASHVPGASWDVLFMEPARLPIPPVLPAPAEQPGEPAAPGRARRAPCRRGCGTGGHISENRFEPADSTGPTVNPDKKRIGYTPRIARPRTARKSSNRPVFTG
ncbi:hypothetical protein PIB30_032325 [Stylosanthes scabra]|uniref:Uncharacterized protein n=1 Tax=Stylosanthes scabra TaxID=79078 RepID=A0ABU6RCT0_9FABA|nr:hypothetical protein [Stylosanthes scabra]